MKFNDSLSYLENLYIDINKSIKLIKDEIKKADEADETDANKLKKVKKKLKKASKKIRKAINNFSSTNVYDNILHNRAKERTKVSKESIEQKKACEIKDASYVDSVEFTEIPKVNIGKTVGKLPVEAKLKVKGLYDCSIVVNTNKTLVLKSGSVICAGYITKKSEDKSTQLRIKLTKEHKLSSREVEGFKGKKLVLLEDIGFDNKAELHRFVLGRDLRPVDSDVSIMVGNITLDRYLKVGNKDDQE